MSEDRYSGSGEANPPFLSRPLQLRLHPTVPLTWAGAGWAAICGIAAAGALQLSIDIAAQALLTLVLADPVLGGVWAALSRTQRLSLADESDMDRDLVESDVTGRHGVGHRRTEVVRSPDVRTAEEGPAVESLELEASASSFWASVAAGFDERLPLRILDRVGTQSQDGRDHGVENLSDGETDIPRNTPPIRGVWPKLGRLRRVLGEMLRGGVRASQLAWTVMRHDTVFEMALLCGLALVLALVLGSGVVVVVGLGLLFPLVIWFSLGGDPLGHRWVRAVLEIGLPWSVGLAAFTDLPGTTLDGLAGAAVATILWAGEHLAPLTIGLLFVVGHCAKLVLVERPGETNRNQVFLALPQIAVVVLLVAWGRPILAGAAGTLFLGQVLFQPHLRGDRRHWYLASTQWMFMGVMLLAAIGVGFLR